MSEEREIWKTDLEAGKAVRQDKTKEQANAAMMNQEVAKIRMQEELHEEKDKKNHAKSSESPGGTDSHASAG